MGKKILLADDSLTIQKIVELTFEGEGFDLEMVADGREALKKAEASPPDIILADFTMPGLSGMELCRSIRENPTLNPIPVILLINSFDEFDRTEADEAGVTAYVEKPFESQALVDRVHDLLSGETGAATTAPPPKETRPPADDVDLISEEPEEEVEPPPPDKAERDELLEEFHRATAPPAASKVSEEVLILEEIVEEETVAAPPAHPVDEPEVPLAPTDSFVLLEEPSELQVAEEEPSPEVPVSTMDSSDIAEEEQPPAEPSSSPSSDEAAAAAAAAGAILEEAVGDAVRSYIDQLIHQAVEELTPTITSKVLERLEATFPSIAERIIREEIEKLKRGA